MELKNANPNGCNQWSQNKFRVFSQMFIFGRFFKIYIEGMKNLLAIEQNLASFGIIGTCNVIIINNIHPTIFFLKNNENWNT